jgi:hypothetical protein
MQFAKEVSVLEYYFAKHSHSPLGAKKDPYLQLKS